jgi:hypothetical protein
MADTDKPLLNVLNFVMDKLNKPHINKIEEFNEYKDVLLKINTTDFYTELWENYLKDYYKYREIRFGDRNIVKFYLLSLIRKCLKHIKNNKYKFITNRKSEYSDNMVKFRIICTIKKI